MITVENITHSYRNPSGDKNLVLNNISLNVNRGEIISLLGPSGCGKTTLLNLIAGFEKPENGHIVIDGEPVVKPNPRRVTIFQNYGLLPWRTVQKNVELAFENTKKSKDEKNKKALFYLDLVRLTPYKKHHPYQLSGGMQQRVAVARALAAEPDLILMDEPFSALDAVTRKAMQREIRNIRELFGTTIIFVTHDIDEAISISDRIIVMTSHPGRIHSEFIIDIPNEREDFPDDYKKIRSNIVSAFDPWQIKPEYVI